MNAVSKDTAHQRILDPFPGRRRLHCAAHPFVVALELFAAVRREVANRFKEEGNVMVLGVVAHENLLPARAASRESQEVALTLCNVNSWSFSIRCSNIDHPSIRRVPTLRNSQVSCCHLFFLSPGALTPSQYLIRALFLDFEPELFTKLAMVSRAFLYSKIILREPYEFKSRSF